jgi:hypothetical protein
MGGVLFGPNMRLLVLFSITISQVRTIGTIVALVGLNNRAKSLLIIIVDWVCVRLHGVCGSECTCFYHVGEQLQN